MGGESISRRDFTGKLTGSALGIGCLAGLRSVSVEAASKHPLPIGLQLYTVRDLAAKDFTGTLREVAKMGYDGVEFAGYGGLSADELRKRIDDLGLLCAGTHEGFERLEKNLNEVIEYNKTIGNRFLVCPSMPEEWRNKGADGFKAFGEKMNAIGERAAQSDMQLCYHNHSFEFKEENGQLLIESLLLASDPKLVQSEVDVYWVKYADQDPAAWIRRHSGRCPLIHMKDMAKEDRSFAPVGTGILDSKGVIKAARANNAAWYIVEQDSSKRPILGEVATSLKNLRQLLKG